jgi:hypothetical protein
MIERQSCEPIPVPVSATDTITPPPLFVDLGRHTPDPRPILAGHRIDRVRDPTPWVVPWNAAPARNEDARLLVHSSQTL